MAGSFCQCFVLSATKGLAAFAMGNSQLQRLVYSLDPLMPSRLTDLQKILPDRVIPCIVTCTVDLFSNAGICSISSYLRSSKYLSTEMMLSPAFVYSSNVSLSRNSPFRG